MHGLDTSNVSSRVESSRAKWNLSQCEPNDVSKIARLGKREEGTHHPEFKSRTTKNNMVMESMSKLKSAKAKYKQLSIIHDMTQKERTQCKLLVQEAKDKEQQGQEEWIYRVRCPPTDLRIIKMKK